MPTPSTAPDIAHALTQMLLAAAAAPVLAVVAVALIALLMGRR